MTTIIFRQDKKKNPNCDSSIDSNMDHTLLEVEACEFSRFRGSEMAVVQTGKRKSRLTSLPAKSGQASESARGMPWH